MVSVCQMPWFTQAGEEPRQQPSQVAHGVSTPVLALQRSEPAQVQALASATTLAETPPTPAQASASTSGESAWGAVVTMVLGPRVPAPLRPRLRGQLSQ